MEFTNILSTKNITKRKFFSDMREKFKKFFKEKGLQKKWFAEQIGMNPKLLYQILCDPKQHVPKKFWKKIIKMTEGYLTLEDLAELEDEERDEEKK